MQREPSALIVIPARGGSKGIPRKNLRSLVGQPLIAYAIATARASRHRPYVVVTTDDDEIALVAERLGAHVHRRDPRLADDAATLDPVIHDAVTNVEVRLGCRFSLVVTQQPTSPLLRSESLDAAIARMLDDPGIDTVISATNDTHLSWRRDGERYHPNYTERVNRQYLPPTFRETGGFFISRREHVTASGRFGPRVHLHELAMPESIDIDSHADWGLCTHYLRRRRVLFVVTGHRRVGLGHVYHSLLVANDLVDHEVAFLVDRGSTLAFEAIASRHYPVTMQHGESLVDHIADLRPHVVVNDRLDTDLAYMEALGRLGVKTINIEDLGPGAALADAVINAIYPDTDLGGDPRAFFGPAYACLRDEFVLLTPRPASPRVERVLVTFGGTDPGGFTLTVLDAIEVWCAERGIAVDVVTGLGFDDAIDITRFQHARFHKRVDNISAFMRAADVAFTSAGRTLFELASVGTPAIVMAQNERELTHTFAAERHGFVHLGLGRHVAASSILAALSRIVADDAYRHVLRERMLAVDLRQGRSNVVRVIDEIVRHA